MRYARYFVQIYSYDNDKCVERRPIGEKPFKLSRLSKKSLRVYLNMNLKLEQWELFVKEADIHVD